MFSIPAINPGVKKRHPHTLFIFLNKEQVKNEFEEPVSDDQVFGRSLLKSFTVAASYAVQTYGVSIHCDKKLPGNTSLNFLGKY